MVKNTNKTQQKITIWYGYGLFGLLVLGVIISLVIPTIQLLTRPEVNHFNATVFLISLVAGAVLPMLISYFIGDKASRSKNKTLHHYNGVLFGFLAYWLSRFFGTIGSFAAVPIGEAVSGVATAAVFNGWPIIATVVTVSIISYFYHQSKRGEAVLLYKPYMLTFWLAAITVSVFGPLSSMLYSYSDGQYLWSLAWLVGIQVVGFALVVALSYLAFHKKRLARNEKSMLAIIATTVGLLALYVVTPLIPYPAEAGDLMLTLSILGTVASIGIWVSYLVLLRQSIK